MKVNVVMPKMGESINEGTIIKWYKKAGDAVKLDEIIYEISTDKVDTEIPSPAEGIISEIKVFEQETVEVDTIVAVIETEGEEESEKETPEPVDVIPSTTQVGGEIIDIPMPKMGESIMEGTIIKWHKKVGDKVNLDEIIYEISTDKVDTEIPSPAEGTLVEILFGENETVEVGTVLAKISTSGGIVKTPAASAVKENVEEIKSGSHPESKQEIVQAEPEKTIKPDSDRFNSPLVMTIAKKENVSFVELERIKGTGISGRVTKKDILGYLNSRGSAPTQEVEQESLITELKKEKAEVEAPESASGESTQIIPMDNIRQRIMFHMTNSRDTSVHVSVVVEVDMTKIHNYIQKNKSLFTQQEGVKLTYMPFISYACIKGLKAFPYVNSSIDEKNIVLKKYINLGIAVAVEPNGLIVPNIKKADEKSIRGLAKSIAELSHKSRNKGLMPDDIMNGTFTITNYGVFGSLFGTPIINQPEVAILGVGVVTKKPVVVERDGIDSIAIKPMMYLSLSHDHRLIDGMIGGKFLKKIKDVLENFDTSVI